MSYTFDGVGNVDLYKNDAYLHITEQDYSYDALYQLTGVNATSTAKILAPRYDASYSQTFDFDDNGNIETKTSTSQCNMQASRVNDLNYEIESVYDPAYAHRVVNSGDVYYQYDANGNITLEHQGLIPEEGPQEMRTVEQFDNAYGTDYGFAIVEKPAGGTYCGTSYREFTWNERNLMRTSRDSRYRVDYRYGADGQRAIKQSSKSETLYYNSMWQLKSNYGPKMRQSKHIYVGETRFVTKCSIRGDDDNVSYESQNIYYYHADHLGSTELVTDVDGLIYERIEYTPYGELWIEEKGSEPTPFRFTGKELDEETGLYYYGARYLDPKYSRWLSADPALGEYIPGAPVNEEARKRNSNLPGMGGVFNTINLHLYHYAGNNPVKYIDPDGRVVWFAVGLIAVALIGVGGVAHAPTVFQPDVANKLSTIAYDDGKAGPAFQNNSARRTTVSFPLSSDIVGAVGAAMPRGMPGPNDYQDYSDRTPTTGCKAMDAVGLAGTVLENLTDGRGNKVGDVKLNIEKVNGDINKWNIQKTLIGIDGTPETTIMSKNEANQYLIDNKQRLIEEGIYGDVQKYLDN